MNKISHSTTNNECFKPVKKSICAWCNMTIGIFPIDNYCSIISHGICKICFEACINKLKLSHDKNY